MRWICPVLAVLVLSACDGGRGVAPATPGSVTPRADASVSSDGGGGADGSSSGTYAQRCGQACAAPTEGPCAGRTATDCARDCVVLTEGLPATCAACLAEQSGWAGERCTCEGVGCTLCPFGPGGRVCGGAAPDDTCAASDEQCAGYTLGAASRGTCAAACGADAGVPALPSYDDRCALACRRPSSGPCRDDGREQACVAACRARVTGLPAACALCVLDDSGWAGSRCGCYGEGCGLCPFGPGGRACQSPLPTDTCGAADEVCSGFEVGEVSRGRCAEVCQ